MRRLLPLLPLLLASSAATAAPILPGSEAPALTPDPWVTQPPEQIDLLLYVGSWCPLSREVLDQLSERDDLSIAAISSEPLPALERFLEVGGWEGLALGADPERALWEAWLGDPLVGQPLPYAFVLGEAGHVLWRGPAVEPGAEEPLAALIGVLEAVESGAWDLTQAQAQAQEQARVLQLIEALQAHRGARHLGKLARKLEDLEIPEELEEQAADAYNEVAWTFITTQADSSTELELGLRLAEQSLEIRPDHPATMDTHARALWDLGRREEAFAIQERAVTLATGTGMEGELRPALEEYAAALDRSLEAPEEQGEPEPWQGSVNQAFRATAPEQRLIVRPQSLEDADLEARWAEVMGGVLGMFSRNASPDAPPLELHLPDAVDEESLAELAPVLYGSPSANPLVARVLEHHGLALESEGLRVGEKLIPAPDPFLIAALPSPWAPELPVILYTGLSDTGTLDLNAVFHGPNGLLMGSNDPDGKRLTLLQVDPIFERGRLTSLGLGPAVLTGAQVAEDLEALHALLAKEYAGWSDLQWSLRGEGSDWHTRTTAFTEQVRTRPRVLWDEAYQLLLDYLAPVQDTHFYMEGSSLGPEGAVKRSDRLVDSLVPYFADGVVGPEAHGLEVIPGPASVEADRPYLFPTLPQDGHDPAYLVGMMVDPDAVPLRLELPSGEELEIHRGRSRARTRGSWDLSEPPDSPLPVLGVRTMNRKHLEGMAETAIELRDESTVVLDLRNNGGGSDQPAHDWVARFSNEHYHWACSAQVVKTTGHPLRHWKSWSDSGYRVSGGDYAEAPYDGRLVVLVDTGVASSGETFAFLASTVEGAVLVGENSSGCTAYGNVESHDPLPHSKISLWFGRSRFVWECTRPVVEGVGIFPDYWLDVEDPVGWLAENPPQGL